MNWFIVNQNDSFLFWSNENGWTDYYSADSFNEEETKTFNLPDEGSWILMS